MHNDLRRKLSWLLFLRLLVFTMLVLSTLLNREEGRSAGYDAIRHILLTIGGSTYLVAVVSLWCIRRADSLRDLTTIAYLQIIIDAMLSGTLVMLTGGASSVFTFLFSLGIINASILLHRPGAITGATISAVVYGLIVLVELGYIPVAEWIQLSTRDEVYNGISSNLVAFIAVGLLAGQLTEQLRTTRSALEQREITLADLRRLNDLIVNSVQIGILTISHERRVIFVNRWVEELTGFLPSQLLNRPLTRHFPMLNRSIDDRREAGDFVHFEERDLLRSDGKMIKARINFFPLSDHAQNVIGRVVTIENITEIHILEQLAMANQQMATIGQLASGIAHEIRNPLAAISGSVQLLQMNESTSSDDEKLLSIVIKETDYLNGLISDLLTYARPTSIERSNVDLGELIDETIVILKNSDMLEKHSSIARTGESRLIAYVDASKVKQIVWNLLANALQAMPDGGEVSVDLRRNALESEVEIVITDQGAGIDQDILPRIFDPFYTTKHSGTGLGLATTHRIVRDHQGSIRADNPAAGGARFTVCLPLISKPDQEIA